jgi:hypothetical protein
MGRLLEFPLHQGGAVLVEVDDEQSAPKRGWGDSGRITVEPVAQTFDQAVKSIRPAAEVLLSELRDLGDGPTEINIEFGLELSAEVGAFIAKSGGKATFKISITWHRGSG